MGADEVIDYTTTDFSDVLSDLDYVFDSVSKNDDAIIKSMKTLKNGGEVTNLNNDVLYGENAVKFAKDKNIKYGFEIIESNGEDIKEIARLLESGKLKTHIYKAFAFKDLEEAFETLAKGRTRGKIVITMEH